MKMADYLTSRYTNKLLEQTFLFLLTAVHECFGFKAALANATPAKNQLSKKYF